MKKNIKFYLFLMNFFTYSMNGLGLVNTLERHNQQEYTFHITDGEIDSYGYISIENKNYSSIFIDSENLIWCDIFHSDIVDIFIVNAPQLERLCCINNINLMNINLLGAPNLKELDMQLNGMSGEGITLDLLNNLKINWFLYFENCSYIEDNFNLEKGAYLKKLILPKVVSFKQFDWRPNKKNVKKIRIKGDMTSITEEDLPIESFTDRQLKSSALFHIYRKLNDMGKNLSKRKRRRSSIIKCNFKEN